MGENKDTNINLRTTSKMKADLEKIAKADVRSLSSMIEILLMEAIEARRKGKK